MRIALVRPADPTGCGTTSLASALTTAGHRVRTVTGVPYDLATTWADAPPDVVHAVGPDAAEAAAHTGVPTVAVVPPGSPGTPPEGPDRLLVASEDQRAALLGRGVARSRLRVVPACVDPGAFTPAGPSLHRGPQPRLLVHGSLAPGHGAGAAIAALPRVPGAELYLAGGCDDVDPDRRRLFTAARELGVAGRVRFLGPVRPELLPRLLRSADVLVAAPERDVSAVPVLQAMACGRAVVASAVGGLRDAVVDGVTGVQVPPGRVAELAAAIRTVLADDALRLGYGIAGRDRARSRYDPARIAEAVLAVHRELVPPARTPDDDARAGHPARIPSG